MKIIESCDLGFGIVITNEDLPAKLSEEELANLRAEQRREAKFEMMDDYLQYGNQ
jgi:hypothetical protein